MKNIPVKTDLYNMSSSIERIEICGFQMYGPIPHKRKVSNQVLALR